MLNAADFLGTWVLSRTIKDHLGTMDGSLKGKAAFHADGGTLRYSESGALKLALGPVMQAERSYLWAFQGDRVVVQFDDGAAFHDFAPNGLSDGTQHLCGTDLYKCTYDFRAWPAWSATWQVKGPRKDYVSVSQYIRPS